jgi:hypothetical protein
MEMTSKAYARVGAAVAAGAGVAVVVETELAAAGAAAAAGLLAVCPTAISMHTNPTARILPIMNDTHLKSYSSTQLKLLKSLSAVSGSPMFHSW